MFRSNVLLVLIGVVASLPALCAEPVADLPPGPLQTRVRTACLECHDSGVIVQQRLGKASWTKEVDKMIKWGAVVDSADKEGFIEYLSTNFSTDKTPSVALRTAMPKKK